MEWRLKSTALKNLGQIFFSSTNFQFSIAFTNKFADPYPDTYKMHFEWEKRAFYSLFTTGWSGSRLQVWDQVLALLKAISEDNLIHCQALGVQAPAQARTQCFPVSCSSCWQLLASLRKLSYHSCDADLVLESKRFWCFVNIGQLLVINNFLVACEMKILIDLQEKLLPSCNANQRSAQCFAQSLCHLLVSN